MNQEQIPSLYCYWLRYKEYSETLKEEIKQMLVKRNQRILMPELISSLNQMTISYGLLYVVIEGYIVLNQKTMT